MRAKYNGYRVLDVIDSNDLDTWMPPDPEDFEFQMDFYAGPEDEESADAFTVRVCSFKWFMREFGSKIASAEHTILMPRFDARELINFLRARCAAIEGDRWEALAVQLHGFGRWEFAYRL